MANPVSWRTNSASAIRTGSPTSSETELVDAVCPAGDDQDRLSAEFRLEDERFCDLAYYAAYGQCSLSGAASALRQFDNVQREPEPR